MCFRELTRRIEASAVRRLVTRALALARDLRDVASYTLRSLFTNDSLLE